MFNFTPTSIFTQFWPDLLILWNFWTAVNQKTKYCNDRSWQKVFLELSKLFWFMVSQKTFKKKIVHLSNFDSHNFNFAMHSRRANFWSIAWTVQLGLQSWWRWSWIGDAVQRGTNETLSYVTQPSRPMDALIQSLRSEIKYEF